jgi:UV DNA damage endonuclease
MIVRLGYVAIAMKLPKVTSSSTVTYTNYQKLGTQEKRLNKLKAVTLTNLDDLHTILQYNVQNNIHFYRITSSLIPLSTHPEVTDWNYRNIFDKEFERIGRLIKENNLRVDTHPNEFNVINSTKPEVVKSAERNLLSHVHLFEDIDYPHGKMVLHIGGAEGGKEAGMRRFIDNLSSFPESISRKLMLENDDKVYTAKEVLRICNEVKLPIVFDVHHHNCNNESEPIEELLEDIFKTWEGQPLPPKFHFSSPRDSERDRKHADYINPEDFIAFIEKCRVFNLDMDVMLETKQKDLSLYKLVEDIKVLKPDWNWIDNSTLSI